MSGVEFSLPPVVGIAGWSNSGKSTMICQLLQDERLRDWRLGVIKHCHHSLKESEESDTARFLAAGAQVAVPWVAGDLGTAALADAALAAALESLSNLTLDGVLVEGFKRGSHPQIWIDQSEGPPSEIAARVLHCPDSDALLPLVVNLLWRGRTVRAGILVGGQSQRMGRPKALIPVNGAALWRKLQASCTLNRLNAVLIGELPGVPTGLVDADFPGPVGGLIAAVRADPNAAWLMLPCDLPCWSEAAASWLLEQRRPGARAIMPRLGDHALPFPAIYEPGLLADLLSRGADLRWSPQRWLNSRRDVIRVPVPEELVRAFTSVNTPEEWIALLGSPPLPSQGD